MSDEQEIDELRGDIADTRQDMSRTIEQLEEKLSVSSLQAQLTESLQQAMDQMLSVFTDKTGDLTGKMSSQIESALQNAASSKVDQLLEQVGSKATSAGGSLWQRISQNPVPIALAAVGVGLLAAEGERMRATAAGQNGAGVGASIKETVDGQIAGLREGISSAKDRVQTMSSANYGEDASLSTGVGDGIAKIRGAVSDQALVPGILALGIGIVAGLALPETGPERAASGSMRDRIMDGLDQMKLTDSSGNGGGMLDKVKTDASTLLSEAADATKVAAGEVRQSASDMRSELSETLRQPSISTTGD